MAIQSYYGKRNRPHRTDIEGLDGDQEVLLQTLRLEIRNVRRRLCNVQDLTTFYVNVDTIPATQQKAKSLGGRILKKRKAIGGGMGYWGTIGDPHGNVIGLWSKK
ncbi:hypothetical protein AUF78_02300 [archaeon 13_1_20CM_2_51_12]|nr:MAG: hypothetical protein AUF78_02300 [archaeon 13_1_20CM_2_51_12]